MIAANDMTRRNIVLVVDDSADSLSLLTDILEPAGMMVLVATEGAAAIDLVGRVTPDIVVLDAVMPVMDGFATCRALKADKQSSDIPVIFMTGLSETEHVVKGFDAGGVDYVTKPIVPEELVARIRVHLENARLAKSARAALDATGRYLLAATGSGRLLWWTPQANRVLGGLLPAPDDPSPLLPAAVRQWLGELAGGGASTSPFPLPPAADGTRHQLAFVGQSGPDEYLLRLIGQEGGQAADLLRRRLALTAREAEVLSWLAQGKSNRDIGEILNLSPRTVNKHLEQIYAKLGVENRTSAAALALRALESR